MPRVKASPKKCIKSNLQQPTNSWVFLLKGEALELSEQYTGTGTPDIVTLRHPNTGESAVFLFSPANNSVQEILTYNEAKRSWFIDETVKSDGKMHLSTPIDPIFLVLPYLRKYCSSQAIPLDQLLRDEEFPETERLLKSSGLKYLNMIADRKGDEELNAFKYNEEKTLSWLKKKTERVAEILKQKNIHVGSGAVSATFVKSSKSESSDSDSHLRYAHGIVSEYLMDDLSQKLLKYLNLPDDPQFNLKRKSTNPLSPNEAKKTKIEEENKSSTSNVLDLSKPEPKSAKSAAASAKDKARAKAASGSKTISSFFKKT
ncbi:ribonuclease H2 subunit B [Tribolium castaneum]|uniref:Ribonuclease H2 subunit B n=1 Tax=Tribolium castaneum TaxID=7070 RepID=D6WMH9_TRICA|nr:PREDICTED: ribonuclease H2 subunit B [Tribolium castaneum]EFA04271.1 Ribonuclease H2 subunit B-like Protein [Tribolium castaneum]|eukprot:XP_968060.1 PREDICTED: ribonuclease H2 subunit B [Tribolium castaneum]